MANYKAIAEEICTILGKTYTERVGLHEPHFAGNELKYVSDCVETGWVSSVGSYVDRISEDLSKFCKSPYAIPVANGTVALQIALEELGVESDDEVLIPSLTFVATANAVLYLKAIPHFVDSDVESLGVNCGKLAEYLENIAEIRGNECWNTKTKRRIKAIVPVHVFGHPVDMDPLLEIAKRFHLGVVEDAAEAIGSEYKGKPAGTIAPLGTLSFNGNKVITTGGGGAILAADKAQGEHIKHVANTAKIQHAWEFRHTEKGYNFRMPNLNAALGCAQLEILPKALEMKRKLQAAYCDWFSNFEDGEIFTEASYAKSNYWLNAMILKEESFELRDAILDSTNAKQIGTRPLWVLMHRLDFLSKYPKMNLSTAESLEKRIVNLPSSWFLVDKFGL